MKRSLIRLFAVLALLAMLAAACGGESNGDDDNADSAESAEDSGDGADGSEGDEPEGDEDADTDETDAGSGESNVYEDPRGGVFAEFQTGFDRGDNPFGQVDSFCVTHPAAEDRVDTDPGITADEIKIGHIRSTLEQGVEIGFGIPIGDSKEMFEVFVDYVNEECGGVRGRQLDLGYVEAPILGAEVDVQRNQACLAMTEDHGSVVVMNSTGFQGTANLCIVEEKSTAFVSTQGQPEEFMERGEDRLVSISLTLEESVRLAVADLLESGALEGATIGVAAPNTPGQAEAVENGLVVPLEEAGFVRGETIIFDVIDCAGGTICGGGVAESVANMRDAGIDSFFNVLNVVSAPGYIAEMANQGFEPGDVQFYATDFNSQSGELVSGNIANNPDAGALYNGAVIIDFRTTGDIRDPEFAPTPIQQMCNDLYTANSPSGASHNWDDEGDASYNQVAGVCTILRIALRALYQAGDNPTIAEVQAALANLGPVDVPPMTPASIMPGKTQAADVLQTFDYIFPCDLPFAYTADGREANCVQGRGDFRMIER